jgi:hypothetical protein
MRRVLRKFATIAILSLAVPLAPAGATMATESGSTPSPASLDPGEFVWQPEHSPGGDVEIVVSLPMQLLYVYRGGTLIGASTISSGQAGYETPTGRFEILQKKRHHRSNLYDDAPMPFMQRLTWDGVALHAGQVPGYPASHGCIRLPMGFARHLFGATQLGASVHVLDSEVSAQDALALARTDARAETALAGGE